MNSLPPGTLSALLSIWHPEYDPAECLLRGSAAGLGYHSTLPAGAPVHTTRESTAYAVALLLSGEPALVSRAHDILDRVLSLQCLDEHLVVSGRLAYGIWAWYSEERVEDLVPPDQNWADFIGAQLINALVLASDRLAPAMKERIETALYHAAHAIRIRNSGPGYTNIALMGTAVTLAAGQLLGDHVLLDYGRERLRRVHAYTIDYDGFPEFNSPTYTIVALVEIGRMLRDFRAEDDRQLARDLYDFVWRDIALHWHPPTREWAGPHKRSYRTCFSPEMRSTLQCALLPLDIGIPNPIPTLLDIGVDTPCPEKWRPCFTETPVRRIVSQPIEHGPAPLRGVTFFTDDYCLGTAESWQTWKQQAPLVAYVRDDQGEAGSIRLHLLHDGNPRVAGWDIPDLPGGWVRCFQRENFVLAATGICTDGVHHSRRENARFIASDLRVRLEIAQPSFSANPVASHTWLSAGTIRLPLSPSLDLFFALAGADFAGFPVSFEFHTGLPVSSRTLLPHLPAPPQQAIALDIILYHGESRCFHLDEVAHAYASVALALLRRSDPTPPAPSLTTTPRAISASTRWSTPLGAIRLDFPPGPLSQEQHYTWDREHSSSPRPPGRNTIVENL